MQKFRVTGMSCGHCVKAVTKAVTAVDPVARVEVNLAAGIVAVEGAAPRSTLAAAITDAGYAVDAAPPAGA